MINKKYTIYWDNAGNTESETTSAKSLTCWGLT